jgi:hypothetical protein
MFICDYCREQTNTVCLPQAKLSFSFISISASVNENLPIQGKKSEEISNIINHGLEKKDVYDVCLSFRGKGNVCIGCFLKCFAERKT